MKSEDRVDQQAGRPVTTGASGGTKRKRLAKQRGDVDDLNVRHGTHGTLRLLVKRARRKRRHGVASVSRAAGAAWPRRSIAFTALRILRSCTRKTQRGLGRDIAKARHERRILRLSAVKVQRIRNSRRSSRKKKKKNTPHLFFYSIRGRMETRGSLGLS